MNFVIQNVELCIKNEDFCIQNGVVLQDRSGDGTEGPHSDLSATERLSV